MEHVKLEYKLDMRFHLHYQFGIFTLTDSDTKFYVPTDGIETYDVTGNLNRTGMEVYLTVLLRGLAEIAERIMKFMNWTPAQFHDHIVTKLGAMFTNLKSPHVAYAFPISPGENFSREVIDFLSKPHEIPIRIVAGYTLSHDGKYNFDVIDGECRLFQTPQTVTGLFAVEGNATASGFDLVSGLICQEMVRHIYRHKDQWPTSEAKGFLYSMMSDIVDLADKRNYRSN